MGSLFDLAVEYVLSNEGGFSDDPVDSGGPTNYGIILPILKEMGMDVDQDNDIDYDDIRKLTREDAKLIYKTLWWDKQKYGLISSQSIATKILDTAVNMGKYQGTLVAQRALKACDNPVKEDGIFGLKTIAALNTTSSIILLPALRSEQAGIYRLIIQKRPDQVKFQKGWFDRAYK